MNSILKALDIDPKVLKHIAPTGKKVKFDKVKTSIPMKADYNFQMDYLELPTTKEGYNRLLVMVDLATDEVDFEPTKNKDSATTLKAMQNIFKRPYLNKPYASIRTDSGTEFQGDVKKFLFSQSILHRPGISGRHKQTGNVEMANKQISTILNAYMNNIEYNTRKIYREWTDILPQVRKLINKVRKKILGKETPIAEITDNLPMYKVNDLVYRKLDKPQNMQGVYQKTDNFRSGDIRWEFNARAITDVFFYPVNIRYKLNGLPFVSFTEDELKPATEEEETFEIREIIGHKMIKKKLHYLVWWRGEKKKEATFEPAEQLYKDNVEDHIEFYKTKYKVK